MLWTKNSQKEDKDTIKSKWGQEVDRRWSNSGQRTENGQKVGY